MPPLDSPRNSCSLEYCNADPCCHDFLSDHQITSHQPTLLLTFPRPHGNENSVSVIAPTSCPFRHRNHSTRAGLRNCSLVSPHHIGRFHILGIHLPASPWSQGTASRPLLPIRDRIPHYIGSEFGFSTIRASQVRRNPYPFVRDAGGDASVGF